MADDIEKLRREIDGVDDELLTLLNRRAELARRIGALKGASATYRPERETEILRSLEKRNPGPLPAERATAVFREVISACRAMEAPIRVAYLGPQGTFSEQAMYKHFGHAVEGVAFASMDEVFRGSESSGTQFSVVPVENSTEGVVGRSLDLLLGTPLKICAEIELRVHQNVMSKMTSLAAVRKVYSHPQSLGQCAAWLGRTLPAAERVPATSNAEAARLASLEDGAAAIAGEAAAERWGLAILARAIEDEPSNTTRFVVLGSIEPEPSGKDRTSIVLSAENKPGAVHALLTPLAEHKVSMTRIESRPLRTRASLWEYFFFIDVEGHQKDPAVARAIDGLREKAPFLKVLGSYPVAVP
jgi:chorismate mutase/prephenate dehydratase